MSSPTHLSQEGVDALRHLRDRREVNTVILRYPDAPPGDLVVELEGNLTHEELVRALSADAARLVLHELSFATREGTRRHETLLILWMPSGADAQEESYTAGYTDLKQLLGGVRVHLTARRAEQLDYRRLVALAG